MKKPAKPTFALGDRVKLREQGASYAMNRGIVVKRHGKHSPRNPRVRWDSGWGVTSKAEALQLLTPEEAAQYPVPAPCAGDV
jgi:hypothetical protein